LRGNLRSTEAGRRPINRQIWLSLPRVSTDVQVSTSTGRTTPRCSATPAYVRTLRFCCHNRSITGFEPSRDAPDTSLRRGPGLRSVGFVLRRHSQGSHLPRPISARGGIRTHGPLQERILSPPPLSRLGHPRAIVNPGAPPMGVSVAPRHQSTERLPSPSGSGAISSSVRRSTTWMTPRSFFAGHTSAARTL
jgi:hypothetical protein